MKKLLVGAVALLILVSFGSRATPQDQESSATLAETMEWIKLRLNESRRLRIEVPAMSASTFDRRIR